MNPARSRLVTHAFTRGGLLSGADDTTPTTDCGGVRFGPAGRKSLAKHDDDVGGVSCSIHDRFVTLLYETARLGGGTENGRRNQTRYRLGCYKTAAQHRPLRT